jgi:hypothetical protein
MKKVSVKNLSLLGIVLTAASAVTAAVIPDNSDAKRAKNGELRLYSATAQGTDRDAPEAIVSCVQVSGAVVCTASASNTTTGVFDEQSLIQIGSIFYQTVGNTSQNGVQSVLQAQ